MTLQFDPSPYLAAFQYGQNRDQQARNTAAQGIQGVGQGVEQLAQIPAQQREQRMNELLTGLKLKEQGIDPGNAMNYLHTGQISQPAMPSPDQTSQPSPMPFLSQSMPPQNSSTDMQPSNIPPQEPGGFSDQMNGSGESPIVAAHNQHLRSKGLPGVTSSQSTPQTGFSSIFQTQPLDMSRVNDPTYVASLPPKQQQILEKQRTENRLDRDFQLQQDMRKQNSEFQHQMQSDSLDLRKKQQSMEQDKFNETQWANLFKEANPETASSRTPVGIAARANSNADRALATLSKPDVTPQEAANVMADVASIYQNGSPNEFGMKHQEYNTLYGQLKSAIQFATGLPQNGMTDGVKQRLTSVLNELKNVNTGVINRNFDNIEKARGKFLDSSGHRTDWNDLRTKYQSSNSAVSPGANQSLGQPAPGMTRFQASDGSMHDIPTKNLRLAQQRDPGLKVMQ